LNKINSKKTFFEKEPGEKSIFTINDDLKKEQNRQDFKKILG
jgi:hypothetical protein